MRIVHYPHPALRHPAASVTNIDKRLRRQVGEMFELMYDAKGLGLAAPQVAMPVQLLVMNVEGDPSRKDAERVYVNPVITKRQGTLDGDEGCLSFPGLYAKVKRAKRITVQAYDLEGKLVTVEAADLEARAWQHEIDHLNGVLFIDKFATLAKLTRGKDIRAFENAFRAAQERGDIPKDAEIERTLHALERELTSSS